jgi:hypothetical protein
MATIVETVPLDATDAERAAKTYEIAKAVVDLREAGLNPCFVMVEATSGGDVFVIEHDDA